MCADFSAMCIYTMTLWAGCEKLRIAARRSGFYSLAVRWWLWWAVRLEVRRGGQRLRVRCCPPWDGPQRKPDCMSWGWTADLVTPETLCLNGTEHVTGLPSVIIMQELHKNAIKLHMKLIEDNIEQTHELSPWSVWDAMAWYPQIWIYF